VSVAASPRPPVFRRREELFGIAVICRARNLVAALGGRFSNELGIDLDRGGEEIERWALAATLLSNRVSISVALRTYKVLERAGIRTIGDVGTRNRKELVSLLNEGGYVDYGYVGNDESTASRLCALADAIARRCDGRLGVLGERFTDSEELERVLGALPGWGPMTARAFLRELRGLWPGADVVLGHRLAAAARHLHLPDESDALRSLAAASHLDFRDLEAGLVRLWFSHDLGGCPGGEECLFAGSERTGLRHY
jgi:hypothetical protein